MLAGLYGDEDHQGQVQGLAVQQGDAGEDDAGVLQSLDPFPARRWRHPEGWRAADGRWRPERWSCALFLQQIADPAPQLGDHRQTLQIAIDGEPVFQPALDRGAQDDDPPLAGHALSEKGRSHGSAQAVFRRRTGRGHGIEGQDLGVGGQFVADLVGDQLPIVGPGPVTDQRHIQRASLSQTRRHAWRSDQVHVQIHQFVDLPAAARLFPHADDDVVGAGRRGVAVADIGELQLDVGEFAPKGFDVGQDEVVAEAGHTAQAQAVGGAAGRDLVPGSHQFGAGDAEGLGQQQGVLGRFDPLPHAKEQGEGQGLLDRLDPVADGRRRDQKLVGGALEAAAPHHRLDGHAARSPLSQRRGGHRRRARWHDPVQDRARGQRRGPADAEPPRTAERLFHGLCARRGAARRLVPVRPLHARPDPGAEARSGGQGGGHHRRRAGLFGGRRHQGLGRDGGRVGPRRVALHQGQPAVRRAHGDDARLDQADGQADHRHGQRPGRRHGRRPGLGRRHPHGLGPGLFPVGLCAERPGPVGRIALAAAEAGGSGQDLRVADDRRSRQRPGSAGRRLRQPCRAA
uniref:LigA n=1 Tax=Parastrongyloides trichosuri TaxID=131310 RepID=A0A0N4ZL19_PARTI